MDSSVHSQEFWPLKVEALQAPWRYQFGDEFSEVEMTVVYLSNSFPEPVENYVCEEIEQLRRCGVCVLPCSIWRPKTNHFAELASGTKYVFPLQPFWCLRATLLLILSCWLIRDLLWRVVRGPEPYAQKLRALAHTWIGAYLAALFRTEKVNHIHVHHGYFSAWVGMVAARMLGCGFSMTLHGSDLLINASYIDAKLANCSFCFTVSDFNCEYLLTQYPSADPHKVLVQRMGVDLKRWQPRNATSPVSPKKFSIATVGRLHAVKDHVFLLLACRALKDKGVHLQCLIAGEGEERPKLEKLIEQLGLKGEVHLLGHVKREKLPELYAWADAFVLTSRSEGLPITLMEAMAMGRVVVAPQITGLSEIVEDGVSGFLYPPGDMNEFVVRLQLIANCGHALDKMRSAARRQIEANFNGPQNLADFAERFVRLIQQQSLKDNEGATQPHENSLLQQI